jgi:hypothetical protein
MAPRHRQVVAGLGRQPPTARADRRVRVVVDLAAGDHRRPLVEQPGDGAHQPGLALAALAEEHDVVAGEQGALQLGQHGVVEPDDAGERVTTCAQCRDQVGADLGLHAAVLQPLGSQRAEGHRTGTELESGHAGKVRRTPASCDVTVSWSSCSGWCHSDRMRMARRALAATAAACLVVTGGQLSGQQAASAPVGTASTAAAAAPLARVAPENASPPAGTRHQGRPRRAVGPHLPARGRHALHPALPTRAALPRPRRQ